jgi:hypothetical protein
VKLVLFFPDKFGALQIQCYVVRIRRAASAPGRWCIRRTVSNTFRPLISIQFKTRFARELKPPSPDHPSKAFNTVNPLLSPARDVLLARLIYFGLVLSVLSPRVFKSVRQGYKLMRVKKLFVNTVHHRRSINGMPLLRFYQK